jgi:hypothetical protein
MRAITIVILGLFTACGKPQSYNVEKTNENFHDYLPKGPHEVELIELTKSPRATELSQRFYEAIQTNSDWYLEEEKKAKVLDQFVPYDQRMGLTKDEYEEFKEILKNGFGNEYAKIGTESITINYSNNKITFQSKGQLEIFNTVTIDLNDLKVNVGNHTFGQVDLIDVIEDNNSFKSGWKGYRWSNTGPIDSPKPISLTIGKLTRDKKTYVGLQILESSYGMPIDKKFQFKF